MVNRATHLHIKNRRFRFVCIGHECRYVIEIPSFLCAV
jgi:hypothetical protein